MTPRVRRYAREIAWWHGIDHRLIFSCDRHRNVVHARADVMRRLRAENFTLLQIGRWLGRDHTTVLHHLRSN